MTQSLMITSISLMVLSRKNYYQRDVIPVIFQVLRILRYDHRILRAIVL